MDVLFMKECIANLHDTLGIPYKFIADRCGISGTHLTLWLRGEKNLSQQTFKRVCKYYEDFKVEVAAL